MIFVAHRRFKSTALCGDVNIPALSVCEEKNGIIFYKNKPICYVKCETAHQYFAKNNDEQGLLRGKLTQSIQKKLIKYNNKSIWNKIQNDSICKKYRRFKDDEDTWLWNHEFFNADIDDLQYIANLIGAKIK